MKWKNVYIVKCNMIYSADKEPIHPTYLAFISSIGTCNKSLSHYNVVICSYVFFKVFIVLFVNTFNSSLKHP